MEATNEIVLQANLQLGLLDEVDEAMEMGIWNVTCLLLRVPAKSGRCNAKKRSYRRFPFVKGVLFIIWLKKTGENRIWMDSRSNSRSARWHHFGIFSGRVIHDNQVGKEWKTEKTWSWNKSRSNVRRTALFMVEDDLKLLNFHHEWSRQQQNYERQIG